MIPFYNKTYKNKFLFITILSIFIASCARPDDGFAPSAAALDVVEFSSTEKVISGNYEIQGTTEEVLDRQVSGTVTIEGVFNE